MTPEQEERLARSRHNGGHRRKVRTVEVEAIPCPETMHQYPHQLTNARNATRCVSCGKTWAELDQEMRSGRG